MATLRSDQCPAPAVAPLRVRWGLASRLSLALTGAAALVFATAFYYNFQESRQYILNSTRETITSLSSAIISDLGAILKDSSDVADHLAKGIESGLDEAGLQKEVETAVLDCSYCNGATLIFDAGGDAGSPVERRILRCQYQRSPLSWQVICDSTVAPTDVDAITAPEVEGWHMTSARLTDREQSVAIYTRPVHRMEHGVVVRVGNVRAEFPLYLLSTAVANLRIFQKGYVFILSSMGQYLANPDHERVISEKLMNQIYHNNNRLLERVNRELCAINEEMLFVTLFAAVLNPQTGELKFSNAGHNPPLIRRSDGNAEFMVIPPGLPLGIGPDCHYPSVGAHLDPGDILLLYTDGVTEAMNSANACFEAHRLLAVSRISATINPRQWVDEVVTAVAAYVGMAEQSDDLTLLAVARPSSMIEPTVE